MASEWPAVILAKSDMMGWKRNPLGDTWYEEDEGTTFGLYIHRDAARAWQAFRDWLNGVDDGKMDARAARCLFDCEEAWQAGYDRAMHDVENA